MLYKVKAKFNPNLLADFFRKLTDGTIRRQKPDGLEIVASMKRAILIEKNNLEWYEHCFCEIPLNHERTTIYDNYFHKFEITLVDEIRDDIIGDSFWEYMSQQ